MRKRAPKGSFRVFVRSWWRDNPEWPNGLEPHAGRKTTICWFMTEESARAAAQAYNATHNPGRYSRKAEIEEV